MRYFLEISYKGTHYHGFQIQPDHPSVQRQLESVLSKVLNKKTGITGSGRTDSGVHCIQSYIHFDTDNALPENLTHRLNTMLPSDIAVTRTIPVKPDAHARYDAIRRGYRYYIHFSKNPFLLDRSYFYHYQKPDIGLMQQAAAIFPQYEDFKILSKRDPSVKSTICTIYESKLETINSGQQLVFHVEANRFLYNMVRRMVGALLMAGTERITVDHLRQCLAENKNLPRAAMVPPQGLFLTKVAYPFIKPGTQI